MSAPAFDAVIAGGGLSGMSLAAHLAVGGWRDRRVLVVDDATAEPTAGWAFWAARPGLLDAAVSRRYGQVRVSAAGTSRVLSLGRYRYQVVRRADLYRVVTGMLDDCPNVTLRPGRVERIDDGVDAACVVVDGEPVYARWVFDSVTAAGDAEVDARLAFTGYELRCARGVFDPGTPTLFDFRTPQGPGANFGYVLPQSPRRALVELTEFVGGGARPRPPEVRLRALAGYLGEVTGGVDYEILRTESAVLALRAHPPPRGRRRVQPIGARAGLIKASTGYAYQRIQRDSAAIAASLARHGHPFDRRPAPRRYRLLDAVLLDVLAHDPAELEQAFARLFLANPAERVLRFLDEESSLGEERRLIASLSPMPFLRAAARRGARRGA